jgi:hypothetical protein
MEKDNSQSKTILIQVRNDLIPSEQREKPKTGGVLDDQGFYRTPDGSFWDYDDEYFNKCGFDIHGGYYNKEMEYMPGPTWLSNLGCYPEEADKYKNIDLNKLEDDMFDEGEGDEMDVDDDFKGDFECEDGDMISNEELARMYLGGDSKDILKHLDAYMGVPAKNVNTNKSKKKNNKKAAKKKAKAEEDEESWETVSDDEDDNDNNNKDLK